MRRRLQFLVVAAFAFTPFLSLVTGKADTIGIVQQRSVQQHKQATSLLGKAGKGKLSNECSYLNTGLGTQKVIREWLEREDWADSLDETARKVSKAGPDCFKQIAYFPIEKQVEIEKIKEILGKEDMTESEEVTLGETQMKLKWYMFDWLHFGTEEGRVKVLRVDFKKSGF